MMTNTAGDKTTVVFFSLWAYNGEYGEEIKVAQGERNGNINSQWSQSECRGSCLYVLKREEILHSKLHTQVLAVKIFFPALKSSMSTHNINGSYIDKACDVLFIVKCFLGKAKISDDSFV